MVNTVDLYTSTDVKKVRESLYKEQGYKDALTGEPLVLKEAVLDHDHNTQLVRGVLHRQSNVMLGKIENAYMRYMKYWYKPGLPTFLRKAADYLERQENRPDTRWYHPGWLKKIKAMFNKLNSTSKDAVLSSLSKEKGTNDTARKKIFDKVLLTKSAGFDKLKSLISQRS